MSLFQTPEWEDFKLQTGWQKSYRVDGVLVLEKNLPTGKTMLYSPRVGNDLKEKINSKEFVEKIREIADNDNSIFYRLEIDDLKEKASSYKLKASSFIKSFEEMQPENTLVLDIDQEEEEILKQMKQKGRYNIKVAKKHNLKIKKTESIASFYKLYCDMARRQKISFRDKIYFQKLIDILKPKGYVEVFEAILEEKTLASAIIGYCDDYAIYLFGGSSLDMKNVMAPYLLHWEIIRDAKSKGIKKYDFFGISPEGEEKHKWSGVTAFKEKFGGDRIELIGSWDLVFRPFQYRLFKLAERFRRGSD